LSNKNILETMSRDDLLRYIDVLSKNILTIDGFYFLAIEKRYGLETAIEIDKESWEKYAVTEAKRIKELLNITDGSLEDLQRAIQLVAFAPVSAMETAIKDGKLTVAITKCRPQYARTRDGKGEFPCKPVGLAHLSVFAKEVCPKIKTKCVCAPPDRHPKEYYCSWNFFF